MHWFMDNLIATCLIKENLRLTFGGKGEGRNEI